MYLAFGRNMSIVHEANNGCQKGKSLLWHEMGFQLSLDFVLKLYLDELQKKINENYLLDLFLGCKKFIFYRYECKLIITFSFSLSREFVSNLYCSSSTILQEANFHDFPKIMWLLRQCNKYVSWKNLEINCY